MLKLIPFNPIWVQHDRLDLKAIYRRPHMEPDAYGDHHQTLDKDGMPEWDIVGPLPIKNHNKWAAKGFEYVTLANRESLVEAYRKGTLLPEGAVPRDYDQHRTGGPWNYRLWLEGRAGEADSAFALLKADVEKFGADAVESIRRRIDPSFTLPPSLRSEPKPRKAGAAA